MDSARGEMTQAHLYIPPDHIPALEVFLEAFEGPLDLLLYLIKRQNLDILDIDVAAITEQYMQYVELMMRCVRVGRRVFGDGRHAGRDQVADAAALASGESG
jgi:hypothetical protein